MLTLRVPAADWSWRRWRALRLLPAVVLCCALAASGCSQPLSPLEEAAIGGAVIKDTLRRYPLDSRPAAQRRIALVAGKLAEQTVTLLPFRVLLVSCPEWTAFSGPGNVVFICSTLADSTTDDEELAAVIAHEYAHCLLQHYAQRVQAGAVSGALVPQASGAMLRYSRSREQEREADARAMRIMAEAGYNPAKAVSLWERRLAVEDQTATPYTTHPVNSERVQAAKDELPRVLPVYERAQRGL